MVIVSFVSDGLKRVLFLIAALAIVAITCAFVWFVGGMVVGAYNAIPPSNHEECVLHWLYFLGCGAAWLLAIAVFLACARSCFEKAAE